MKIFRIFKDLRNYAFLLRTIGQASRTERWKQMNLRRAWLGVSYTVVNLPPEVAEGEPMYYKAYVIEQLRPVNEYMESLNLTEIISVRVRRLPEDRGPDGKAVAAYLVRYVPLFRELTFWWILRWTVIIVSAWLLWTPGSRLVSSLVSNIMEAVR